MIYRVKIKLMEDIHHSKKDKIYLYRFLMGIFSLLCTAFSFVLFLCQDKNLTQEQIYSDSLLSVVELKAESAGVGESFGSAVFVKKDGTLVTNAHVVTFAEDGKTKSFENISIRFAFENDYRAVTLVKYDGDLDIAVLKLNSTNCKFKAIKISDSSKIKTGNNVYAVGNLNNVGISITKGLISNKSLNVEYSGKTRNVIQCDLVIAEGNSGGALINQKGELLGLTTFRLKDSEGGNVIYGICYCVPANAVVEYIK